MDAMDAIDGLKALEQVVETIGEELHDLYQRRGIPQIERVTLQTLEWTLAKLADDLHTMETEVKDLRLSVAAARTLDLQRLGDMSRIAKERDQLRAQVAELTKKVGELPAEQVEPVEPGPAAAVGAVLPWSHWKFGTRLVKWPMRTEIVERGIRTMPDNGQSSDVFRIVGNTRWFDLSHLYSIGWREDAAATQPDPLGESPSYQWQVGDEVWLNGEVYEVSLIRDGQCFVTGGGQGTQRQLESCGYWLYRKASDKPDSTGTDGEGQS